MKGAEIARDQGPGQVRFVKDQGRTWRTNGEKRDYMERPGNIWRELPLHVEARETQGHADNTHTQTRPRLQTLGTNLYPICANLSSWFQYIVQVAEVKSFSMPGAAARECHAGAKLFRHRLRQIYQICMSFFHKLCGHTEGFLR